MLSWFLLVIAHICVWQWHWFYAWIYGWFCQIASLNTFSQCFGSLLYLRLLPERVTIWFLLWQFGCPVFISLAWLLWIDLPELFWIKVVEGGTLDLLQILNKTSTSSSCSIYSCWCFISGLYYVMFLLIWSTFLSCRNEFY